MCCTNADIIFSIPVTHFHQGLMEKKQGDYSIQARNYHTSFKAEVVLFIYFGFYITMLFSN